MIRNLKVNTHTFSKKKFKVSKRIFSLLLAGVLYLGGCGVGNSNKNSNNIPVTTSTTKTEQEVSTSTYAIKKGEVTKEIKETPISLDTSALEEFSLILKNFPVTYSFEEIDTLILDENISLDVTEPMHTEDFSIIKDGKVDIDLFYTSVINQNEEYRKETKHYMYKLIEDKKELKNILQMVCDAINAKIEENKITDFKTLDCVLQQVKVYYGTGVNNASVTNEYCLLVNPNMITMMDVIHDNENSFRNVLYHEAQHLIQKECPHMKKEEYTQAGLSKIYTDAVYDAYSWLWMDEGSAEKQMMNTLDESPTTYAHIVGYLNTMDYVGAISITPSSTIVEDCSIKRDGSSFYENFTPLSISRKDVFKMMYAMNIAQHKSENFKSLYEKYYGVSLTEKEYEEIRVSYKTKYCEELTKIFYAKLAVLISNKEVTLEDVFALIKIYEGDLNYHLDLYKDSSSMNQELLEMYSSIQEAFFQSIAQSNAMSMEDIVYNFKTYTLYKEEESISLNGVFAWLTEEERKYFYTRSQSDEIWYTEDLRTIFETQEEVKKSK